MRGPRWKWGWDGVALERRSAAGPSGGRRSLASDAGRPLRRLPASSQSPGIRRPRRKWRQSWSAWLGWPPLKSNRAAAEALREQLDQTAESKARESYGQAMRIIRAAMSEEAFAAAWAEGKGLTLERIVVEFIKETASPKQVGAGKKGSGGAIAAGSAPEAV
jgi:hypothetical protein